ncbi:hypothetical protein GZ22_13215 [Terribacillus saccharophilus]|uniref:Very short patch repair endonuclease n=1 Tax=Terribacillus saccharophilus TaxID=361277 RepID=A0A075LSP2_9BACI|nr:very short patch repair endonuclease [Terribacillus goriensis]AIF67498.1 hypothetical protein GZ22_13215 [Terribacillus goriensis]
MPDTITKKQRRKNMQAIRSMGEGNTAKKKCNSLFGKPDFAIKNYKVVIFIDGCFWHGCKYRSNVPKSNQEYWIQKISRNKLRDQEVTQYYTAHEWNILRIWEHDLIIELEETIDKIVDFITEAKQQVGDSYSNIIFNYLTS